MCVCVGGGLCVCVGGGGGGSGGVFHLSSTTPSISDTHTGIIQKNYTPL